jgi:hypothetical protein
MNGTVAWMPRRLWLIGTLRFREWIQGWSRCARDWCSELIDLNKEVYSEQKTMASRLSRQLKRDGNTHSFFRSKLHSTGEWACSKFLPDPELPGLSKRLFDAIVRRKQLPLFGPEHSCASAKHGSQPYPCSARQLYRFRWTARFDPFG